MSEYTPRQRCAIAYPIIDSGAIPHARHLKRNGNVQSILTFDVAEISKLVDAPEDIVARAKDGWFGIWHGRVTTHPLTPTDCWDSLTIASAEGTITRLVAGVGLMDDIEVHNGSDLKSIHVYKWATIEELELADKLVGGFPELEPVDEIA